MFYQYQTDKNYPKNYQHTFDICLLLLLFSFVSNRTIWTKTQFCLLSFNLKRMAIVSPNLGGGVEKNNQEEQKLLDEDMEDLRVSHLRVLEEWDDVEDLDILDLEVENWAVNDRKVDALQEVGLVGLFLAHRNDRKVDLLHIVRFVGLVLSHLNVSRMVYDREVDLLHVISFFGFGFVLDVSSWLL